MKTFLENYHGEDYYLYTLKKGKYTISVSTYGATLCNFIYDGVDIVQGFENVKSYVEEVKYMNAVIGRVCNRIADGRFSLNGQNYKLFINNGPNSLHGGEYGFDTKKWEIEEIGNTLLCHYQSKDGEEGYPGKLDIYVTYELNDDGLLFGYTAISDKDTLLSICNHAFFNINGLHSLSILDDYLTIDADEYALVDENGLTLECHEKVADTPFDFRQKKKIGRDINSSNKQLANAHGYDHHFLIRGEGFRHFLTYENAHLMMDVYSDMPGMHLYTANYLDGLAHGKKGNNYPSRSSVCFETQYYPNAINMEGPKKPILRAGEVIKHKTIYRLRSK